MTQTLADFNLVMVKAYKAEAAITRYRAVKWGTNDDEVIACTDGDTPVGVSLNTAAIGASVRVCRLGIAPCEVNAAVAKGAVVAAAAAAGLIDDNGSAGEVGLGYAERAATAQNDIIPVFVCPVRIHA